MGGSTGTSFGFPMVAVVMPFTLMMARGILSILGSYLY